MTALIDLAKKLHMEPENSECVLSDFIHQHHFPIVEENRATFFYWDNTPTDSVNLMHWVYGLESRQAFRRIPNTNAFWLSIDLPYASRVEYKFEVHRGDNRYWMRDPHNDERAFDPFGSNSVCSMPGYSQPRWSKPNSKVRRGRLEEFTIWSEAYQEKRVIQTRW